MLYNYLKIAIRNLIRHKAFSFINIFGLALGMTCSILLLLWVRDEVNYDSFHQNRANLYRVMANTYWGDVQTSQNTPAPLTEVLKRELPEVMQVSKVTYPEGGIFKVGTKINREQNGIYVDEDFFRMFTFPLRQGNPAKVLAAPDAIVLSETMARKYFGRENAMGKIVQIKEQGNFRVTGVMQDLPKNSSIQADFIRSYTYYEKSRPWMKYWGNFNLMTYVALRPGASVEAVNAKIKSLLKKHNPEGTRDELFLHPYTRLRLHSKFTNGKPDGGRIEYVRLFSVVAIFILVIACINFMNLATARSAQRAREVGVRKVIGAAKKYLVAQFMGEAILVALLAMLLAMLLVDRLLPVFNEITGKNIAISLLDPQFLLLFLSTAFFTGMLSGSYPALFLSSLKPVSVLKGTLKFKPSAVYLRQGLVVFQFMLSIVLIIGTLIIYYQINYIKNKNLGIDRENVLMVGLNSTINKHQAAFMHDLQQVPGITAITTAEGNPLQVSGTSGDIDWPGKPKKGAAIAPLQVGYDFIRTMNIKLTAGRDFSREIRTDTSNYIINEAAARMMEMKEPLHQVIGFWQGKGRIIGVMQDYHLQSLHQAIGPLILVLKPTEPSLALIKVSNKNLAATLAGMEQTIKKYNPEEPFEYQFLDEAFENQYKSETIIGKLTSFFAAIAIVISCLGLFGLALFTAEQRTKEIGIRKVLGASVGAIVGMLSKDFLKLVLVANVIAWPLSWYFMQTWLQSFEYRIPIGWWIFALAGGATLFIALLTVSFQAVRAAVTNPVQALRRE